jgi:hypothetical protein
MTEPFFRLHFSDDVSDARCQLLGQKNRGQKNKEPQKAGLMVM